MLLVISITKQSEINSVYLFVFILQLKFCNQSHSLSEQFHHRPATILPHSQHNSTTVPSSFYHCFCSSSRFALGRIPHNPTLDRTFLFAVIIVNLCNPFHPFSFQMKRGKGQGGRRRGGRDTEAREGEGGGKQKKVADEWTVCVAIYQCLAECKPKSCFQLNFYYLCVEEFYNISEF